MCQRLTSSDFLNSSPPILNIYMYGYVLVAFLLQREITTKAIYRRVYWGLAYSFQGLEFMTIMVRKMAGHWNGSSTLTSDP